MKYFLQIAGIVFQFEADRPIEIDDMMIPFMIQYTNKTDVHVELSWKWESCPVPTSPQLGEDMISEYYQEENMLFVLIRGGYKGPIACSVSSLDFKHITCYINAKPFIAPPENLGSFLRFLPLRMIFLHFGAVFLHASRIDWDNHGILFTAPSGTGKTTQAKLWQQYRNAEILCNDRTICKKEADSWITYGFPIDGSEPVRSNRICALSCIVILEQAQTNYIERLGAGKALAKLMQQVVFDTWSGEDHTASMNALIEIMEDVPVYLLRCTPNEDAVVCLENKLKEESVI